MTALFPGDTLMESDVIAGRSDGRDRLVRALARPSVVVILLTVAGGLAGVGIVSPLALLTTILDAAAALVVLVPAIVFGHVILRIFRLKNLPSRWVFVLSAGLGLGTLSVLVLLGGLVGILQRSLWLAELGAMLAMGIWSIRRAQTPRASIPYTTKWSYLWVTVAPFLTLAFLAASNAPGMIWQEEGHGYDVLEYHLQLPKEYLQNQEITYIPHNVYSAFPANMEMLYLLAMVVHRDVLDIGTTTNMIHLAFAVLTVMAAWAIGVDVSPKAGIMAGLLAATCTWLEYLSGLAYVENGMLFYGLCSAGLATRAEHEGRSVAIMAGALAGFAAGCKYTAIPMLAMPIGLLFLLRSRNWRRGVCGYCVFTFGTIIAASPWLVKNWTSTGNPVFPLMNELWNGQPTGWSGEETRSWNRGHSAPADTSVMDRLDALWSKVPADHEQRSGPAVLGLGLLGLWSRRRERVDAVLLVVLGFQMLVWLFATHLYARFAIPMIVPLVILGARAIPDDAGRMRQMVILCVLLGGAVWNFSFAADRHSRESAPGIPGSVFAEGRMPGYEYLGTINVHAAKDDQKWLLLGEARPFYLQVSCDYFVPFNHNPFFELIYKQKSSDEIVEWLKGNEYTGILVNWSEVRRIASTYGFHPPTTEQQLSTTMELLTARGVLRAKSFYHPGNPSMRYVDIYEPTHTLGSDR